MKKTIEIKCNDYQLQKIKGAVILILDGEYVNWKFSGIENIVAEIDGMGATITFEVDGDSEEYKMWQEHCKE